LSPKEENMIKHNLEEITIKSAKGLYPEGDYINDDLLLFNEVADVPLPSEPRKMSCLLMALCINGTAQYTVDTVEHKVNAGDLIIISEGQVIDDFMLSDDCRGIAIMVSYDFFREVIAGIHELSSLFIFSRNHPVCNLLKEEVSNIVNYFKLIKSKVQEVDHHFRKDVVRMLLSTMIYDVSNAIYRIQNTSTQRRTRAESIFTEFIKLVENNFRNERRVGWYSQQLCITPKYLSETIKAVSHRTPNEWIDNYVTLEIRILLKNSSKSIKEIAQDLHFPNQSFLGKYFKEHVGMSPSKYRSLQ